MLELGSSFRTHNKKLSLCLNLLQETLLYAQSHTEELLNALRDHITVGWYRPRHQLHSSVYHSVSGHLGQSTASITVINFFNGLRVIPSIAILYS